MKKCARFASFCVGMANKSFEYHLNRTKNALYVSINFPLHEGNGVNVVAWFSCFRLIICGLLLFYSFFNCMSQSTAVWRSLHILPLSAPHSQLIKYLLNIHIFITSDACSITWICDMQFIAH